MKRMNQQWLNILWRPLMGQQEQYREQKKKEEE